MVDRLVTKKVFSHPLPLHSCDVTFQPKVMPCPIQLHSTHSRQVVVMMYGLSLGEISGHRLWDSPSAGQSSHDPARPRLYNMEFYLQNESFKQFEDEWWNELLSYRHSERKDDAKFVLTYVMYFVLNIRLKVELLEKLIIFFIVTLSLVLFESVHISVFVTFINDRQLIL